jgi:hypothetical protein
MTLGFNCSETIRWKSDIFQPFRLVVDDEAGDVLKVKSGAK